MSDSVRTSAEHSHQIMLQRSERVGPLPCYRACFRVYTFELHGMASVHLFLTNLEQMKCQLALQQLLHASLCLNALPQYTTDDQRMPRVGEVSG